VKEMRRIIIEILCNKEAIQKIKRRLGALKAHYDVHFDVENPSDWFLRIVSRGGKDGMLFLIHLYRKLKSDYELAECIVDLYYAQEIFRVDDFLEYMGWSWEEIEATVEKLKKKRRNYERKILRFVYRALSS